MFQRNNHRISWIVDSLLYFMILYLPGKCAGGTIFSPIYVMLLQMQFKSVNQWARTLEMCRASLLTFPFHNFLFVHLVRFDGPLGFTLFSNIPHFRKLCLYPNMKTVFSTSNISLLGNANWDHSNPRIIILCERRLIACNGFC